MVELKPDFVGEVTTEGEEPKGDAIIVPVALALPDRVEMNETKIDILEDKVKNLEHDLDQIMSMSLVALLCGITAVFAVLIGGFTGVII